MHFILYYVTPFEILKMNYLILQQTHHDKVSSVFTFNLVSHCWVLTNPSSIMQLLSMYLGWLFSVSTNMHMIKDIWRYLIWTCMSFITFFPSCIQANGKANNRIKQFFKLAHAWGLAFVPGIMHPHTKKLQKWNKFFLISCLLAAFVDPLFFFILSVDKVIYKSICFEPQCLVDINCQQYRDMLEL